MSAENSRFIMWDMAGTLIPFDTVSGRPRGLPECGDFLPELGRDYRMVCTTGDSTAGARGLLENFEILPHLETVFGDLNQPVGKPYGEILREMEGDPALSLAIGDRLRADIPSDTGDVVTLLINQDGEINTAGMVSYMLHILNRQDAADLPTAFRHLTITAAIDKEAVGPRGGGRITEAWRRNDGFDYCLWVFEHDALAGERLVIRLGGCVDDD